MKRKALSLLMAVAMLLSLTVIPAAAAESEATSAGTPSYGDVSGHWAEGAIDRWSGYGVVQGDQAGNFNPNADMTVAELATTLNNVMGYTVAAENTFADLKGDEWYADAVLKLAAAGIIKGDGVNVNATAPIDRERATVILARALNIQPTANADLSGFNDGASAADWSAGYIKAMADAGIIKGVGDSTLALAANINRASVMTIMSNAVSDYITTGGTHELVGTGITIIKAKTDVVLTGNAKDVIVAPGSATGSVTLDKVTVTGTVSMNAANAKLIAKDATLANVTVSAASATVDLQGTSNVKNVVIASTATDANLTVAKGATVDTMTSSANSLTVSGEGTVKNAVITGGENVKVTTPGTIIDNKGTSDVTTDKGVVKPGESNGSTGGGGGSGGGSGGGDVSDDTYYAVSYNGNGSTGGTNVVDTAKYKTGTKATAADNTYVKTGYVFLNWNTKADGTGTSYAAKAEITVSGNVTLYAQWQNVISFADLTNVSVADKSYQVDLPSAYAIAGITFANNKLTIDTTKLANVASAADGSYTYSKADASDVTYRANSNCDAYWAMYNSSSLTVGFQFTAPETITATKFQYSDSSFDDAAGNAATPLVDINFFASFIQIHKDGSIDVANGDTFDFYVIWQDDAGTKVQQHVTVTVVLTAPAPTL